MPKFYFSPKTTIICAVLIAAMLRLSYWQYERHQAKLGYVQELADRIQAPIKDINNEIPAIISTPDQALFYRYRISGEFDYSREMILRNRKLDKLPGVHVITPLRLKDSPNSILISRGYIPLALTTPEERKKLQGPAKFEGIGIAKLSSTANFLAPQDPNPKPGEWFEQWLRIDIPKISKQLPYSVLPIYLELLASETPPDINKEIVTSSSDRAEIFFMPTQKNLPSRQDAIDLNLTSPVPVISTIVPPSRHLGYVFEWGVMAIMTGLIGLVLQLRRPKIIVGLEDQK